MSDHEQAVSDDEAALFEGYEPVPAPAVEPMSPGRRRTLRQAEDIALGRHPLTGGMIHPLASRSRDASAPKDDPFTCGSCSFRESITYHDKTYAKCVPPGNLSAEQYERYGPPRLSHSEASDVRSWWPACRDYSPGSSISPDA